jgi:hypothetical protein
LRCSINRHSPRLDEILRLDTQRVGQARDVVEVADHLGRIVDRAVVEPMSAQRVQVGGRHLVLVARELGGEHTQRPIDRAERRASPIADDGVDVGVGLRRVGDQLPDLFTEVMRVGLRSVVAA